MGSETWLLKKHGLLRYIVLIFSHLKYIHKNIMIGSTTKHIKPKTLEYM
jgi:hypothetical protein